MFKILDGRDCFWQWDSNQRLIVEDPSITEVHFCNKTDDCSLVCKTYEQDGLTLVNVPNIILQDDWDIRVYAFMENFTKVEKKIKVKGRSKPSDYIYTETEIYSLEKIKNEVDEAVAICEEAASKVDEASTLAIEAHEAAITAEAIAKGKNKGYVFDTVSKMVEALGQSEFISKLTIGDNLYIREVNVPDYWWDGAQAQQLETQKVDLTQYATTEYVNGELGEVNEMLDLVSMALSKVFPVSETLGEKAVTIILNHSTEYRCAMNLTSLQVSIAEGQHQGIFESSVVFTSGISGMEFSADEKILFAGDDVNENGVFVPQPNTKYEIHFRSVTNTYQSEPVIYARVGSWK